MIKIEVKNSNTNRSLIKEDVVPGSWITNLEKSPWGDISNSFGGRHRVWYAGEGLNGGVLLCPEENKGCVEYMLFPDKNVDVMKPWWETVKTDELEIILFNCAKAWLAVGKDIDKLDDDCKTIVQDLEDPKNTLIPEQFKITWNNVQLKATKGEELMDLVGESIREEISILINKVPHDLPPEAEELAAKIESALSDWMKIALESEVEVNHELDPEITISPEMLDRPGDGHGAMKPSVGDHHMGGHGGCGGGKKIKISISK